MHDVGHFAEGGAAEHTGLLSAPAECLHGGPSHISVKLTNASILCALKSCVAVVERVLC
jgi:hypothetical protein